MKRVNRKDLWNLNKKFFVFTVYRPIKFSMLRLKIHKKRKSLKKMMILKYIRFRRSQDHQKGAQDYKQLKSSKGKLQKKNNQNTLQVIDTI